MTFENPTYETQWLAYTKRIHRLLSVRHGPRDWKTTLTDVWSMAAPSHHETYLMKHTLGTLIPVALPYPTSLDVWLATLPEAALVAALVRCSNQTQFPVHKVQYQETQYRERARYAILTQLERTRVRLFEAIERVRMTMTGGIGVDGLDIVARSIQRVQSAATTPHTSSFHALCADLATAIRYSRTTGEDDASERQRRVEAASVALEWCLAVTSFIFTTAAATTTRSMAATMAAAAATSPRRTTRRMAAGANATTTTSTSPSNLGADVTAALVSAQHSWGLLLEDDVTKTAQTRDHILRLVWETMTDAADPSCRASPVWAALASALLHTDGWRLYESRATWHMALQVACDSPLRVVAAGQRWNTGRLAPSDDEIGETVAEELAKVCPSDIKAVWEERIKQKKWPRMDVVADTPLPDEDDWVMSPHVDVTVYSLAPWWHALVQQQQQQQQQQQPETPRRSVVDDDVAKSSLSLTLSKDVVVSVAADATDADASSKDCGGTEHVNDNGDVNTRGGDDVSMDGDDDESSRPTLLEPRNQETAASVAALRRVSELTARLERLGSDTADDASVGGSDSEQDHRDRAQTRTVVAELMRASWRGLKRRDRYDPAAKRNDAVTPWCLTPATHWVIVSPASTKLTIRLTIPSSVEDIEAMDKAAVLRRRQCQQTEADGPSTPPWSDYVTSELKRRRVKCQQEWRRIKRMGMALGSGRRTWVAMDEDDDGDDDDNDHDGGDTSDPDVETASGGTGRRRHPDRGATRTVVRTQRPPYGIWTDLKHDERGHALDEAENPDKWIHRVPARMRPICLLSPPWSGDDRSKRVWPQATVVIKGPYNVKVPSDAAALDALFTRHARFVAIEQMLRMGTSTVLVPERHEPWPGEAYVTWPSMGSLVGLAVRTMSREPFRVVTDRQSFVRSVMEIPESDVTPDMAKRILQHLYVRHLLRLGHTGPWSVLHHSSRPGVVAGIHLDSDEGIRASCPTQVDCLCNAEVDRRKTGGLGRAWMLRVLWPHRYSFARWDSKTMALDPAVFPDAVAESIQRQSDMFRMFPES